MADALTELYQNADGQDSEGSPAADASCFGAVLLVGMGSTTQATARYLLDLRAQQPQRVGSVTLYTGKASPAALATAEQLAGEGVHLVTGSTEVQGRYGLGIVSPGLSKFNPFYLSAQAACAVLISEPELAWRISPQHWLAITGTNGKTTTTRLLTHILRMSGRDARAVGNIGTPAISCVDARPEDSYLVAELSSFQLASTQRFAPQAAALLNLSPDHLEWHHSFEDYAASKAAVFAHMEKDALCVLGSDVHCLALARTLRAQGRRVCVVDVSGDRPAASDAAEASGKTGAGTGDRELREQEPDAAWLSATCELYLRVRGRDVCLGSADGLPLRGRHNVANMLAAAALAVEAGVTADDCARALASFAPLEHRLEPCGQDSRGVHFVNDSKATNTDAAQQALAAYTAGSIVLLAGGHDKMTDLHSFARACVQACRAVVCYGEARERLLQALEEASAEAASGPACMEAEHLLDACEKAYSAARPGDTVLLSPACSSYDEFLNYEQRGRAFKTWVNAHTDAAHRMEPGA